MWGGAALAGAFAALLSCAALAEEGVSSGSSPVPSGASSGASDPRPTLRTDQQAEKPETEYTPPTYVDPVAALPDHTTLRTGLYTASGFLAPGLSTASRLGWHFTITQAVRYDDNVRKLRDGAPTPAGRSRGDLYFVTDISGSYRAQIGLQQVFVAGTFGNTAYASESTLDKRRYNLSAGIDWRLGRVCSGTLVGGIDQSEQTLDSTLPGASDSLVHTDSVNFSGRCHVYGRVYSTYGAGFKQIAYSQNALSDQHQFSVNGGLEYAVPKLHTIGFRLSRTDSEFDDAAGRIAASLSTRTEQYQYAIFYRWYGSPKTSFDVSYGYSDIAVHTATGIRRFHAPYYSAGIGWRPTPKLALRLTTQYQTAPSQGVSADYQRSYNHALSLSYAYSRKLSFVAALSHSLTENPTAQTLLGPVAGRNMRANAASIDMNYRASPFLTANLGYRFTQQTDKVTRDRTTSHLYSFRLSYQH